MFILRVSMRQLNKDPNRIPLSYEPLIKIQGLTKKYRNLTVVDNLNLDIHKSCFALLGPNGAGKTTIMLMLLGLVKPTEGTAFILGKNIIDELDCIRNELGFLPENVGFYPNSTGREHVELILSLRNKTKEKREDAELLLKWCGLKKEFWDKKVITYSKGMRQRLGIAQAFAGKPKIVFLDEPLSNIDPLGRDEFIKKLKEKKRGGTTILIASHIVSEIEQIADSVAFIDEGKLKASNTILELSQTYGINEYEICSFHNDIGKSLIELFEILSSKSDQFIEQPRIFGGKIIFRSNKLNRIKKILKDFTHYEIKPINGTLGKIYIKIFRGKNNE
ncbi:hypothetical protein LCGC14_0505500 [marine sediment metagenome]|uniref:ABC transporter domain-containing protein n=1 Tax=marine sediment metagenome TaxID=412755 RepID=A0A0F9S2L4_9ZZZZ